MDEKEFWAEIFASLGHDWPPELLPLGNCDWIEVRKYSLASDEPYVEGKIGLIGSPGGEAKFVLYLRGRPESLAEIEWSASVPKNGAADWISFDEELETIELRP